ncbi:Uncharacterised protein [Clostridioides difficile]|nr:Uncharacterised protein [Clostridioides difficile]
MTCDVRVAAAPHRELAVRDAQHGAVDASAVKGAAAEITPNGRRGSGLTVRGSKRLGLLYEMGVRRAEDTSKKGNAWSEVLEPNLAG